MWEINVGRTKFCEPQVNLHKLRKLCSVVPHFALEFLKESFNFKGKTHQCHCKSKKNKKYNLINMGDKSYLLGFINRNERRAVLGRVRV